MLKMWAAVRWDGPAAQRAYLHIKLRQAARADGDGFSLLIGKRNQPLIHQISIGAPGVFVGKFANEFLLPGMTSTWFRFT